MSRTFVIGLTILFFCNTIFAVTFEAHITLSGTTEPATRAVIVFNLNGVEKARTITGDDGLCLIRDVPPGNYVVKILYREKTKESNFVVPVAPSSRYEFQIER